MPNAGAPSSDRVVGDSAARASAAIGLAGRGAVRKIAPPDAGFCSRFSSRAGFARASAHPPVGAGQITIEVGTPLTFSNTPGTTPCGGIAYFRFFTMVKGGTHGCPRSAHQRGGGPPAGAARLGTVLRRASGTLMRVPGCALVLTEFKLEVIMPVAAFSQRKFHPEGAGNSFADTLARQLASRRFAISRTSTPMSDRSSAKAKVASMNPALLPQSKRRPVKVSALKGARPIISTIASVS